MLTKKFFCPTNAWDCPYFKKDGSCAIADEGDDPTMECDDAGCFYDENEDPFVWEDEEGNHYDASELLEKGYNFVNGEPVLDPPLDPAIKLLTDTLKFLSMGMGKISFPPDFDEMGSNGFKG